MEGFDGIDQKEDQPTLVLDVLEFESKGLGGTRKLDFQVSIDAYESIIGVYLRGKDVFKSLRILNPSGGQIAIVHAWMIESLITTHVEKENKHEDKKYTSPVVLCAYNILNAQQNVEYTAVLLNMWLKYYKRLIFEFEFKGNKQNKDFDLFIHVKRNPLGLVKSMAKGVGKTVGNAVGAVTSKFGRSRDEY